jgi:FHA domain-containing protein
MTLTLLAVSLNEKPLSQPITACFDSKGGTIGRADHNTMALPDPERHISRLQAEIVANGARFMIKNVGAANPIIVAGRSLGQGESALLSHGDEVRVGGYLLKVVDDKNPESISAEITRGRAVVHANTPLPRPAATPLPDIGAPLSGSNPFADLLGPAPVAPAATPARAAAAPDPFADLMPPPAGIAAGSAAVAAAPAPPAARLPDDFDPFADLSPPQPPAAPPAVAPPSPAASPFDDLIPAPGSPSIDAMFGLGDGRRDPLADFLAPAPPPSGGSSRAPQVPTDPLALFGGPAPAPAPSAPVMPDHAPVTQQAISLPAAPPASILPESPSWFAPAAAKPTTPAPRMAPPVEAVSPEPVAPAPAPAPVVAPTPAPPPHAALPAAPAPATMPVAGTSDDNQALWAAFCEGTGVPIDLPGGLTPEAMRMLGEVVYAAIEGTLQLIAVRSTTKQEMRADVTMIQQRANNPLKFSPDARAGLEQLLRPPMRGFLAGPAAMRDAMNDLLGHSIGTMAGMRAALDGVLGRFEPSELEAKLSGGSLLDSVLPMNRKSKLWDLYLQHYLTIRDEAQEDFHTLFGKAFLAAYDQQLERLREGRSRPQDA